MERECCSAIFLLAACCTAHIKVQWIGELPFLDLEWLVPAASRTCSRTCGHLVNGLPSATATAARNGLAQTWPESTPGACTAAHEGVGLLLSGSLLPEVPLEAIHGLHRKAGQTVAGHAAAGSALRQAGGVRAGRVRDPDVHMPKRKRSAPPPTPLPVSSAVRPVHPP